MGRKRKIEIFVLFLFIISKSIAQSTDEILRISDTNLPGTAITKALGGAQISLPYGEGVANNPAVGAFINYSYFQWSNSIYNNKNQLTIYETLQKNNGTNLNIGNITFILNSISNSEQEISEEENSTPKKKTSFGFSLNRTNNFKSNYKLNGINQKSSFTEYLGDLSLEENFINQVVNFNSTNTLAQMGFITYLTNPDENDIYSIGIAQGGNVFQNYVNNTKGAVTDFDFSFSSQFSKKLYLGVSGGLTNYNYSYAKSLVERDEQDVHNYFNVLRIEENLKSVGTGFNFKLGGIYSPKKWLNLALDYHSGNSIVITKKYDAKMSASFTNHPELLDNKDSISLEEASIRTLTSSYSLKTPPKTTFGVSIIDNKIGLFTMDIEYINFANAKFTSIINEDPKANFKQINSDITTNLNQNINIKMGAQLNLKNNRIRAGLAQYNLSSKIPTRTYLSFGYGIETEHSVLSITYVRSIANVDFNDYNLVESVSIQNQSIGTTIVFNLGMKF